METRSGTRSLAHGMAAVAESDDSNLTNERPSTLNTQQEEANSCAQAPAQASRPSGPDANAPTDTAPVRSASLTNGDDQRGASNNEFARGQNFGQNRPLSAVRSSLRAASPQPPPSRGSSVAYEPRAEPPRTR